MSSEEEKVRPRDEILRQFINSSDDSQFVKEFLCWREYIISGPQIFAAFSKVLKEAGSNDIQRWLLRITKLCIKWIDTHPMDFFYEENLLQQFLDWITTTAELYNTADMPLANKNIQYCLTAIENERNNFVNFQVEQRRVKNTYEDYLVRSMEDKRASSVDWKKVNIMKLNPTAVAEELFIKNHELLSEIPTREFLFQRWTKSHKLQSAPNILYCMQQLNATSQWFSSQILAGIKAQDQCDRLMKVIDIAQASLAVRDYHTLLNIISTLNTACMSKIKNAWALLPSNYNKKWEDICVVMNPLGNWKYYRAVTQDAQRSFVPFIGVLLTDMLMVDQGNETYNADGMVNVGKMNMLHSTLQTFITFRKFEVPYESRPELAFLHHLEVDTTDDELYRLAQLRVLAQSCANKRRCVIKAEFVIDVDTIIQLSPKTEGHAVFITWSHADVISKRTKGNKNGESARALCMEQTACWSSALSEDGASSARISFVTNINQDAKTLAFKRKEIVLTLRKVSGDHGKNPAIAKAVINVADFADHKTDVNKTIPLQSKLSVPPLMDFRIRTTWRKYNGKKLLTSESSDSSDVSARETLEVGGLQYLLMTDTEMTDDDFSESDIDAGSDSEAMGDDTFAPIPELNLDGASVEQLSAQLADVRNQFRHMKQQFGRVLTQKEELQQTIDAQALEIKHLQESATQESPRSQPSVERAKESSKHRRTTSGSRKIFKQAKRAVKERSLLQKYYNWIPFGTAKQLEILSLLEVEAEPCSSGDAEMLIDQSQELVQETFRSLLSWGCFVDSGTRSPFLSDLVTALKLCFVRTCEKLENNCLWLNIISGLIIELQKETKLSTKGDLEKDGLLGLESNCPNSKKFQMGAHKSSLSPVEWLEKQLYDIVEEIVESILSFTYRKLDATFSTVTSSTEFPKGLADEWRNVLAMLITFTKGFPWITSSLCQQLIEFCLVYINRKIFNWLLVIPKLCTGASGITIKYSFSQLLDWVAAASSVDKEIYEEQCNQILHAVNLFFCITNPAVLENSDFLPNMYLHLSPAEVNRLAQNMAKSTKVTDAVLLELSKNAEEDPKPHAVSAREILNHFLTQRS